MSLCGVARWPPNYVVALTGASQAGTQCPLAAKIGWCLSGASQAWGARPAMNALSEKGLDRRLDAVAAPLLGTVKSEVRAFQQEFLGRAVVREGGGADAHRYPV